MNVRRAGWFRLAAPIAWAAAWFLLPLGPGPCIAASVREMVEADWLEQAQAWTAGRPPVGRPAPTWADAAGAVDGVKNGKYAFHTDREPNPWWQVDLGQPTDLARIVVYNRLDYAPGLHNADHLLILTSPDGRKWTRRHHNAGKHFGGISGAPPLEVKFGAGEVRGRFVRLQIPSPTPVWFHLDEVEVYGPDDPKKNVALARPADQSSVSQWSTWKITAPAKPPAYRPGFDVTGEIIRRARLLAADLRAAGVDTGPHERELDELAAKLKKLPETAPAWADENAGI